MFRWIRRWLDQRIIRRSQISDDDWQLAMVGLPVLNRLTEREKQRLRDLAIVFLHRKVIEGANGVVITLQMKLIIALQACLPILNLGMRCYRNWVTVIVYPAGFRASREHVDENGVVHQGDSHMLGEAWVRGPVVLSWDDTSIAGEIDGSNLVIHEFAHKLDMQNGRANGYPPLHRHMSHRKWVETFTAAYEDFSRRCQRGQAVEISCYGATAPAEFFAVFSEVFFERPEVIGRYYPEVLELLKQYYRQDPRMDASSFRAGM